MDDFITFATMISRNQIKFVQSLRLKKNRDKYGVFIAEGEKIAAELIDGRQQTELFFALPEWFEQNGDKIPTHINCHPVSGKELERISNLKTPNKVLAVVKKSTPAISKEIFGGGLILMLDKIQDPGNLGTILRTADWFGVSHIICSPDTADVYNPKTIQSSMGSFIRVQTYYTDLVSCIDNLDKQHGLYGAFLSGSTLYDIRPSLPGVLVIGNESKGISEEVSARIQHKLMIPSGARDVQNRAESLNAAMATGIIVSWLTHGADDVAL